ncbi:hypothetical protein DPSP01_007785 [Paraphaeosphaeria sporulosa]
MMRVDGFAGVRKDVESWTSRQWLRTAGAKHRLLRCVAAAPPPLSSANPHIVRPLVGRSLAATGLLVLDQACLLLTAQPGSFPASLFGPCPRSLGSTSLVISLQSLSTPACYTLAQVEKNNIKTDDPVHYGTLADVKCLTSAR